MAYDLYAFDLFAAPRDRYDFLDWISRSFRSVDGPLATDSSRATLALQAWQRDMAQGFPAASDPHAFNADGDSASKNASYHFAQGVVQASFEWDSCGPALYRAKRAAQARGVGLFDASSHDGAVWMISARGRWEVVHHSDDTRQSFA